MNKEIAKKWVKALRSGKYKQGKGFLRTTKNEYCCLGVLCEIHRTVHKKNKWVTKDGVKFYMQTEAALPKTVMKWANVKRQFGSLSSETTLAALNDNGKTFNQIADIIEKRVEAL